jgi:hypothetical protein
MENKGINSKKANTRKIKKNIRKINLGEITSRLTADTSTM